MTEECGARLTLSAINVYPIKSLGGVALDEAWAEPRGLRHDRRWMLVDQNNKFITQREIPGMSLVTPRPGAAGLRVTAPGMEALDLPFEIGGPSRVTVRIFADDCEAIPAGDLFDDWFSRFLDTFCRLVYMPETTRRPAGGDRSNGEALVSFADAYPFLLIGAASLMDLNRRLVAPLPMNRFRPNFVVSGSEAFAEDSWRRIRIGSTTFRVEKSCARCAITTVDQETGTRRGPEPLKTLRDFRLEGAGVLFGRYLAPEPGAGVVRTGDEVEVLASTG